MADNLIVMFDASSSTHEMVPGRSISKIQAAKQLLAERNAWMPDLGYQAGLYIYTRGHMTTLFLKNASGKQKRIFDLPNAASGFSIFLILGVALCLFLPSYISAEMTAIEKCMLEALETGDDDVTMGELRRQCERKAESTEAQDKPPTAVDRRLDVDDENALKPYTLMAHRPNYLLIASHNASGINPELFREQYNDPSIKLDDTEIKFQISIKTPLAVGLFDGAVDIFAAYTNRSFWQAYNAEQSRAFRETNHEPELWFQFRPQLAYHGYEMSVVAVGLKHQSNGQGGMLSRSWNRLFAAFIVERGSWAVSLTPWYRLPEYFEEDDNPDITDYLGHFEIRSALKLSRHTITLMLRNNIESGFSRGAVELAWSFPFLSYRHLKGYLQYYNGYGESLIDYNQHSNSIGVGISITDAL